MLFSIDCIFLQCQYPVMLVLGLGLGLDSVDRGLDAIMLYTYALVFVVWNLCPLDTCLREFWLLLPAQPC